jgi:DNA-directed RNA polymerase subunit RPC12/RpoP
MSPDNSRGLVYRCPVCGAEIGVLVSKMGNFAPRCCNTDMVIQPGKLVFYICPVCSAEVAVLKEGADRFIPRCCNTNMLLEAA